MTPPTADANAGSSTVIVTSTARARSPGRGRRSSPRSRICSARRESPLAIAHGFISLAPTALPTTTAATRERDPPERRRLPVGGAPAARAAGEVRAHADLLERFSKTTLGRCRPTAIVRNYELGSGISRGLAHRFEARTSPQRSPAPLRMPLRTGGRQHLVTGSITQGGAR